MGIPGGSKGKSEELKCIPWQHISIFVCSRGFTDIPDEFNGIPGGLIGIPGDEKRTRSAQRISTIHGCIIHF